MSEDVVLLPRNCRDWPFYVIEMPITKDHEGPAKIGVDAVSICYEVWDKLYRTHGSHDNLPDAINEAIERSLAELKGENDG